MTSTLQVHARPEHGHARPDGQPDGDADEPDGRHAAGVRPKHAVRAHPSWQKCVGFKLARGASIWSSGWAASSSRTFGTTT